ncbi:MAG TPA: hypothetical protein VM238_10530 [Phycisphaerae bacterium]|nr:hypothetical protein [Phycisphaerae bacterium]
MNRRQRIVILAAAARTLTWLAVALAVLLAAAVLAMALGGCSDVLLIPEYSVLLDRTEEISTRDAGRALRGEMTDEQMAASLVLQAGFLRRLRAARDGRDASAPKPK